MIRDYDQNDYDQVLSLMKAMHLDSQYKVHEFDEDSIKFYMDYVLKNDGFFKVVERDGKIVGGAMAMITPYFFSTDRMANDLGFYILPEYRKGRDGLALFKQYIEWGKEKGVYEVQIGGSYYFDSNEHESLKKLLVALGFKPSGEVFKRVL